MKNILSIPRHFGLLALFSTTLTAHSSLLVYEGFDYGATRTDGQTIAGQSAAATLGLQGFYATTTSGGADPGTAVYTNQGLSFDNFLPSSGGALKQSTPAVSTLAFSVAGVTLDTGTQTGTLYSSFLFQRQDQTSANGKFFQVRLNTGNTTGAASAYFRQAADQQTVNRPGTSYGTGNPTTASDTGSIADDTTYLVISRFTNVGTELSAGSPGVATTWVFAQSDYNVWRSIGGSQESTLGDYATWTATQSATSGTFTFANDRAIQFALLGGNDGGAYTIVTDELRWSTTLDVVAIPEPTTATLLLVLTVLVSVVIRRRMPCARHPVPTH